MTRFGLRPELLRQSATVLLQLASEVEVGQLRDPSLPLDQATKPSPFLLAQPIAEANVEQPKLQALLDLGLFSVPGLAIVLTSMEEGGKALDLDLDRLEEITGLPASSALRLLRELSNRQIIDLKSMTDERPSLQITVLPDIERHLRYQFSATFKIDK